MEPIPLWQESILLAPMAEEASYRRFAPDCMAALAPTAEQAKTVKQWIDDKPVGVTLVCEPMPEPDEIMPQTPRRIAYYKQRAKEIFTEPVDFQYLRGADSFIELRYAVLALTDRSGDAIMAELPLEADGLMHDGTQAVAAIGVLQRIGVGTVVLHAATPEDLMDALESVAPYARLSIGVSVDPAWLTEELRLPNVEFFVPRIPEETEALREALRHFKGCVHETRDHDDVLLAPDGKNPHFLDPTVDISDEIDCDHHLGEQLLTLEDETSGAFKLQIDTEDDLIALEEHLYMLSRPVCLCAEVPELLERALQIYPGLALYDGTWALEDQILKYFCEKYGMICL